MKRFGLIGKTLDYSFSKTFFEDYFTKEYFEIFKVRFKKLVVVLLALSGLWFWLDYFNLLN